MTLLTSTGNEHASVLLTIATVLLAGFLATRITKKLRLPNVTGYILAGVAIGPQALGLVSADMLSHMGFVSDVALAFIAFGVGKFLRREIIRAAGVRVFIITMAEALAAGLLVTLTMYFFFHMPLPFSLILGAIATATAPASTMMTIRQYHARGEFVNLLLQVVALDDVVCLLTFSVAAALCNAANSGAAVFAASDVLLPLFYNLLAVAGGALCGVILRCILTPARSKDNRLILAVAMLLAISGLCALADVSPLLSCMVFGAAYINLTDDKHLFRQIDNFTPPILSMFFIISGMNLDVAALGTVGVVGVVYFLVRIVGKYAGSYLACLATHTSKGVRDCLGLALIPQAGVAIGLAFLGRRILNGPSGNLLLTIILSSSVLYEIIGPPCAKLAIFRSGAVTGDPAEPARERGDA